MVRVWIRVRIGGNLLGVIFQGKIFLVLFLLLAKNFVEIWLFTIINLYVYLIYMYVHLYTCISLEEILIRKQALLK